MVPAIVPRFRCVVRMVEGGTRSDWSVAETRVSTAERLLGRCSPARLTPWAEAAAIRGRGRIGMSFEINDLRVRRTTERSEAGA